MQPQKVGKGANLMSIAQITRSLSRSSIPFSILDLKAQAVRLSVSKGAQILLSELLTWSGERGYCWWGKPAIAKDLNWSVSEVWRRATELKGAGLLEVIPRPGRSNYWIPLPGRNKVERVQKDLTPLATPRCPSYEKKTENLKRCTVPNHSTCTEAPPPSPTNVNAVKLFSPDTSPTVPTTSPVDIAQESIPVVQTPSQPAKTPQDPTFPVITQKSEPHPALTQDHLVLVEKIERVTGDTWSRGHFINLVRQVDEQTVYAALSVTREKIALESGVNGGAYFTATLKGMMALAGLGEKSSYPSIPQPLRSPHVPTPSEVRPMSRCIPIEEPDPVDPESLKKGWRVSYKSGGVTSLLTWIQRCVPSTLDVTTLWTDVRTALPEVEESFAMDRFLDTVVTRMKHAKKMMDVGV